EDFEEESSDLDPEEDAEELQELQKEFEEEAAGYQENFQDDLMEILDPEFEEFMEEEGYDMIVMKDGIVSSNTDVNTEDVTEEFVEFSGGEAEGSEDIDLDVEDDE
ncbi:MAG: hypothetical protein ACOCZZ_02210, partial [Bacillota bacterium]